MDPKTVVRAAAVVSLAGTVLACAIDVARFHRTSEHAAELKQDGDDPLRAELARCKALKADAANDSGCKAAWATSRERFLAPGATYQGRTIDPFPGTPDGPSSNAQQKLFSDRGPKRDTGGTLRSAPAER
jgi:conjugative transfer region protein TrbK